MSVSERVFSSSGELSDPSKVALASSQHVLEMAPKLARWSLDSLRGRGDEFARMKTFPAGRQRLSARGEIWKGKNTKTHQKKRDTRKNRAVLVAPC